MELKKKKSDTLEHHQFSGQWGLKLLCKRAQMPGFKLHPGWVGRVTGATEGRELRSTGVCVEGGGRQ